MNYMSYVNQAIKFLGQGFDLTIGKIVFPIAFWEIAVIIFLIFLLILSMAQFRRHYVDWGLKGAIFGVFFGFLLALILEGFLITSGKTALINLLGVKNVPVPLQTALDSSKKQLIQVLGSQSSNTPAVLSENPTSVQDVVSSLQSMSPAELKKVKVLICQP